MVRVRSHIPGKVAVQQSNLLDFAFLLDYRFLQFETIISNSNIVKWSFKCPIIREFKGVKISLKTCDVAIINICNNMSFSAIKMNPQDCKERFSKNSVVHFEVFHQHINWLMSSITLTTSGRSLCESITSLLAVKESLRLLSSKLIYTADIWVTHNYSTSSKHYSNQWRTGMILYFFNDSLFHDPIMKILDSFSASWPPSVLAPRKISDFPTLNSPLIVS